MEVAAVDGVIVVRDSKNPTGPALCVTPAAWTAFVTTTKTGQLDQV